jgi:predicted extracellular nuclease
MHHSTLRSTRRDSTLRGSALRRIGAALAAGLPLAIAAATALAQGSSAPVRTISEIQGSGARSPWVRSRALVRGVVTQLTRQASGFWIQDPAGDGDPFSSDGVFVLLPENAAPPAPGDLVELEARVQELASSGALPLTRLVAVTRLAVLARGVPLPEPAPIVGVPAGSIAAAAQFFESLEGMRVEVRDAPVVAASTRFGELTVVAPWNRFPGSGRSLLTGHLLIRGLGAEVDYNPERLIIARGALPMPATLRPGDRVARALGVLDYTFDNYKIQAAELEVRTRPLPAPPASRRFGLRGDWKVASFNLGNLFDRTDDPVTLDEDSTPSRRELEIKLEKLSQAFVLELALPDIAIVQEVENTTILQQLADRVNERAGTGYVATSFASSDARGIEVGILHDARRVRQLDAFQLAGAEVEAAFGRASESPGREPIAARFQIAGRSVWIVGNHFKSKLGDDPLFGANDPPRRPSELQRKQQARAVRSFAARLLAADPGALLLVGGDLNDFEFAEPGEGPDHPVAILEGAPGELPLFDLLRLEPKGERFSFVFDGNSQLLDHLLASPALLRLLRGVDVLHFNSGFPEELARDASVPFRASDHDPVEARFAFPARLEPRPLR